MMSNTKKKKKNSNSLFAQSKSRSRILFLKESFSYYMINSCCWHSKCEKYTRVLNFRIKFRFETIVDGFVCHILSENLTNCQEQPGILDSCFTMMLPYFRFQNLAAYSCKSSKKYCQIHAIPADSTEYAQRYRYCICIITES